MLIVERNNNTGKYNVWIAYDKKDFIKKTINIYNIDQFNDFCYNKNIENFYNKNNDDQFKIALDFLKNDLSIKVYNSFKELISDYKFEIRKDLNIFFARKAFEYLKQNRYYLSIF